MRARRAQPGCDDQLVCRTMRFAEVRQAAPCGPALLLDNIDIECARDGLPGWSGRRDRETIGAGLARFGCVINACA